MTTMHFLLLSLQESDPTTIFNAMIDSWMEAGVVGSEYDRKGAVQQFIWWHGYFLTSPDRADWEKRSWALIDPQPVPRIDND